MNLDRANLEAALPGYTVTRLIAGGGFGLVFAGQHLRLDRPVAIKILLPGADGAAAARDTFAAEARLLERLAHPHIVRVHDFVERDDLSMIIMEYCGGGTLRRWVRHRPTVVTAVGIGLAVAAALDLAHRQQVIHRDIKPENVLFAGDGTPKVSDFGIAKIVAFSGNPTNTVIGTPAYMAPEQFTGTALRPATDLYSLGIVLYELLSGRTPYSGRGIATYLTQRHLHEPPPPLGAPTPPAIASVVMRALDADPARRPPTAADFANDLVTATTRVFGPGWLQGCTIPLHLPDEIRASAGRGGRTATAPPSVPQGRPTAPRRPAVPDAVETVGYTATDSPPESGTPADDVPAAAQAPATVRAPSPTDLAPPAPVADSPPGRGTPPAGGTRGWWPSRRRSTRKPAARSAGRPVDYRIDSPFGVAVAPDRALIVSQPLLHRISRVDPEFLLDLAPTGVPPHGRGGGLSVVAGTGKAGRTGDGGPASDAELDSPAGIAVGPDGSLLITDSLNDRLCRVSPEGRIETVTVVSGLRRPRSVTVDGDGVIHLADTGNHRVWRLDPDGTARVVAGSGTPGHSGDGGLAIHASLRGPQAVAVDAQGRLLVADQEHRRVRRVDAAGRIETIAGTAYGGRPATAGGPARATDIGAPTSLAVGPDGIVYVADSANNQVLALQGDSTLRVVASRSGPVVVADPRQVAVGPDGTVYIAQPGRHRITIIPG